jgi:hypothetical protein
MLLEKTDCQIENDRVRVTGHKMVPGAHTGVYRHAHADPSTNTNSAGLCSCAIGGLARLWPR